MWLSNEIFQKQKQNISKKQLRRKKNLQIRLKTIAYVSVDSKGKNLSKKQIQNNLDYFRSQQYLL